MRAVFVTTLAAAAAFTAAAAGSTASTRVDWFVVRV